MAKKIGRKYSIRFSILTAFTVLILLSAGLAAVVSYYGHKKSVAILTDDVLKRYKSGVADRLVGCATAVSSALEFCRESVDADLVADATGENILRFLKNAVRRQPQFSAFYYGSALGHFMMAKRMPDGSVSVNFATPTDNGRTHVKWVHENQSWNRMFKEETAEPSATAFDPRKRPWYQAAAEKRGMTWTDAYLFAADGLPGLTCSVPFYDAQGVLQGVLGIDLSAADLSAFMQRNIVEQSTAFVCTLQGDLIAFAAAESGNAEFDLRCREHAANKAGKPVNLRDLNEDSLVQACRLLREELIRKRERTVAEDKHYFFHFLHNHTTFRAAFSRIQAPAHGDWVVGVVVPEDVFLAPVRKQACLTFAACFLIILLGIISGWILSKHLSHALAELDRRMAQVGNFELEVAPASASRLREVDNMTQSFEKMVKGLRSFKKYVPAELVRELILLNREAKPGGERRCLTVLFSDIADFTAFAENTAPEETAEILSRYLTTTSRVIRAHSGTVDKFIGDAVMAFWGAPRPHAAHAADACRAALEMLRQTETPSRTDSSAHAPFHTRIGINTGEVVVANIGSEERMNYTVVGDHVNTAARLEQLNKIYGTKIIAAEATYEAARECVEARMLDVVRVKGKKKPMAVYELLCLKGEMTPRLATIQELFAAGFALYRKRDFEGALKRFEALLQAVPDDPPTRAFVQRCRALASAPPPADWDGVFSASP